MKALDLEEGATAILGRKVGLAALELLHKYVELLMKWQRASRLVGSADPAWIVENIVLDSLLFTKVLPITTRSVLDLGAGGGVPGIPLAIALPELEMTLVESRQKRASFLSQAVRELGLTKARVVRERLAETSTPSGLIGAFDAVVMRCAGDVSTILPVAVPLVRHGGIVVASGPPKAHPLVAGEWVTVTGVRPGATRRFAVVTR